MTAIQSFFALLAMAGAVTIDAGALLTHWEAEPPTGNPDNQVVRFSWTDGDAEFSEILTEGGIANGAFDKDSDAFVCTNHEGDPCTIHFYALARLSPLRLPTAAT